MVEILSSDRNRVISRACCYFYPTVEMKQRFRDDDDDDADDDDGRN